MITHAARWREGSGPADGLRGGRAGEFTATTTAPLPHRVRARGAYRVNPRPTNHILSCGFGVCSRRRYSAKLTRSRKRERQDMAWTTGGGLFGVWRDVLRGGPLPAVSSPRYCYALVQGVSTNALAPIHCGRFFRRFSYTYNIASNSKLYRTTSSTTSPNSITSETNPTLGRYRTRACSSCASAWCGSTAAHAPLHP